MVHRRVPLGPRITGGGNLVVLIADEQDVMVTALAFIAGGVAMLIVIGAVLALVLEWIFKGGAG